MPEAVSHRLACQTCSVEVSVDEGRMPAPTVELFLAYHAGHDVAQEVAEYLPGEGLQ